MSLHRAGDVDEQQQPARLVRTRLPKEPQRLAGRAPRLAGRARDIDAATARGGQMRAALDRRQQADIAFDPAKHGSLGFALAAEVATVEDVGG